MAIDPVTPESIARAKADCARERELIEQQTGVRITGDGTIAHPIRRERISAYRRITEGTAHD